MTVVAFVIAAGVGTAVRHGVNQLGLAWKGTALVNVTGALLLGLLLGTDPTPSTATVVGLGFLGSLTTFSMFALEVAEAGPRQRLAIVTITLVAGIGAAASGHALG